MKRRFLALFGALAGLTLLAAITTPALAGDDDVDGVWCYIPDFSVVADLELPGYDGPKLFATTREDAEWTGVFEGTSIDYGFGGIADPDAPPTLFAATVVFDDVTVNGVSGGMEMDVHGGRQDPFGDWSGTWIITSGTRALRGVGGTGDWWGPGYNLATPDECGVIYYSVDELTGLEEDEDDDDDDDDDDEDDDD